MKASLLRHASAILNMFVVVIGGNGVQNIYLFATIDDMPRYLLSHSRGVVSSSLSYVDQDQNLDRDIPASNLPPNNEET